MTGSGVMYRVAVVTLRRRVYEPRQNYFEIGYLKKLRRVERVWSWYEIRVFDAPAIFLAEKSDSILLSIIVPVGHKLA
jgi:hypothetical protein